MDGARFLPDNASATKVVLRAFNSEMQRVVQRAEGAPDLEESTTFAPYYGFRYEFRLPRYDPTTIVSLTIETVDTSTGEIAFLGYAFFPLFLHKKTKDPVTDNAEQIYIFNEGMY